MEWVKLAIDLLKTLAWPVVVLILGLKSKPLLQGIIDRVKRIKAGGSEIELVDVPSRPQLEATNGPQPEKALPAPKETPQLEAGQPAAEPDLVSYAPAGAVINAWSRVEETMRREAVRLGLLDANEGGVSAGSLITRLRDANLIDAEAAQFAQRLWQLRNQVVHKNARVTEVAAAQFVDTADSLMRTIEMYSDINQLRRIFKELRVDDTNQEQVSQIIVGRLSATANSADPAAAARMARGRSGKWAARAGGVIMMVTERDAALLLARGAELGDPEVRD
jgi:hypothetical protein